MEKSFKIENLSDISEIWYRWLLNSAEYHGELRFHYVTGFGPWDTVWWAMLNPKIVKGGELLTPPLIFLFQDIFLQFF